MSKFTYKKHSNSHIVYYTGYPSFIKCKHVFEIVNTVTGLNQYYIIKTDGLIYTLWEHDGSMNKVLNTEVHLEKTGITGIIVNLEDHAREIVDRINYHETRVWNILNY